jgi:hypothetical protein
MKLMIKSKKSIKSSSSSSNDFRDTILQTLNINIEKLNINRDDLIDSILLLLSRVSDSDLEKINNDLIIKKIYLENDYVNFLKKQSLRKLKQIFKVVKEYDKSYYYLSIIL